MAKDRKKEMSIDDLARLVKGEFDNVYKRFDGVDKRFDHLELQMAEMNKRLDRMETIFVASHDRRIDRLEDSVRLIKTTLRMR